MKIIIFFSEKTLKEGHTLFVATINGEEYVYNEWLVVFPQDTPITIEYIKKYLYRRCPDAKEIGLMDYKAHKSIENPFSKKL